MPKRLKELCEAIFDRRVSKKAFMSLAETVYFEGMIDGILRETESADVEGSDTAA
jgi:hypothetical protein